MVIYGRLLLMAAEQNSRAPSELPICRYMAVSTSDGSKSLRYQVSHKGWGLFLAA